MRKLLFPILIIVILALIGFLGWRLVLNFQELIKEEAEPEKPTIAISPALEGKSILIVVPYNDFDEAEYSALRNLFAISGGSIKIASSQSGAATGDKGNILPLSFSLEEANFAEFDALVFIGGSAPLRNLDDLIVPEIAKEEISQGRAAALTIQEVILPGDFLGLEEFGMGIIEALTNI